MRNAGLDWTRRLDLNSANLPGQPDPPPLLRKAGRLLGCILLSQPKPHPSLPYQSAVRVKIHPLHLYYAHDIIYIIPDKSFQLQLR